MRALLALLVLVSPPAFATSEPEVKTYPALKVTDVVLAISGVTTLIGTSVEIAFHDEAGWAYASLVNGGIGTVFGAVSLALIPRSPAQEFWPYVGPLLFSAACNLVLGIVQVVRAHLH